MVDGGVQEDGGTVPPQTVAVVTDVFFFARLHIRLWFLVSKELMVISHHKVCRDHTAASRQKAFLF